MARRRVFRRRFPSLFVFSRRVLSGQALDTFEACAWHLLAEANGHETAGRMISVCEKDLTAEQMEKGKARAAELRRLIEQKGAE